MSAHGWIRSSLLVGRIEANDPPIGAIELAAALATGPCSSGRLCRTHLFADGTLAWDVGVVEAADLTTVLGGLQSKEAAREGVTGWRIRYKRHIVVNDDSNHRMALTIPPAIEVKVDAKVADYGRAEGRQSLRRIQRMSYELVVRRREEEPHLKTEDWRKTGRDL